MPEQGQKAEWTLGIRQLPHLKRDAPMKPDKKFKALLNTITITVAFLPPGLLSGSNSKIHHYEYVFPDQSIYIFDEDDGFKLIKHISLPQARGIRGVVASPKTHTLYIS